MAQTLLKDGVPFQTPWDPGGSPKETSCENFPDHAACDRTLDRSASPPPCLHLNRHGRPV